ncbi:hypothetical protein FHX42_005230 [Saccharopolyspora lacisalsi]|uniref:Uncharacterized protein n=1 Tax=Halosaccharopolyspora lacisalsi TaxID=1000566 RepID=A0A839E3F9_9PSEU|nr:hypothetical protein [Halosaccharopolyspora lacisalsi]MBA8827823.1 hypothetical protein [Halosaccharopolyspora lacisalsi]
MGGGENSFGVDLDALHKAETGVQDAISELEGLTMWGTSEQAKEGMGLTYGLPTSGWEIGHDDLAAALGEFAEAWEWGVRYLIDDGKDAADALGETRSNYQQVEDSVVHVLDQVAHVAIGNPSKTLEEANTDGQVWGY